MDSGAELDLGHQPLGLVVVALLAVRLQRLGVVVNLQNLVAVIRLTLLKRAVSAYSTNKAQSCSVFVKDGSLLRVHDTGMV